MGYVQTKYPPPPLLPPAPPTPPPQYVMYIDGYELPAVGLTDSQIDQIARRLLEMLDARRRQHTP